MSQDLTNKPESEFQKRVRLEMEKRGKADQKDLLISSLQSEIERLKKENEELWVDNCQLVDQIKGKLKKLESLKSENDKLKEENHRLLNQKEDNWQMYVDANIQVLRKEARIRKYIEEIERLKSSNEGVRELLSKLKYCLAQAETDEDALQFVYELIKQIEPDFLPNGEDKKEEKKIILKCEVHGCKNPATGSGYCEKHTV